MNHKFAKKERVILSLMAVLFILFGCLAPPAARRLEGDGRVLNYVGIVRGATQKLIKEELYGIPNDPLISRLDSIVAELLSGQGPNGLTVLPDDDYQRGTQELQRHWELLKTEISRVRAGGSTQRLYALSEDYYNITDRTALYAQSFGERRAAGITALLVGGNLLFAGLLVVLLAVKCRQKASPHPPADTDPLTGIPSRAHCERHIRAYTDTPPPGDLLVLLFDINGLKAINESRGHQAGDALLTEFAGILTGEGERYGFVGRYGGDEFLALFPNATEELALDYLAAVNERVVAYNLQHVSELHRIHFAVGYSIGGTHELSLPDRIHEADRNLYVRKRQMKSCDA